MARPENSCTEHMFRVPVLEGALPMLDRLAKWHGGRRAALEYILRDALVKEWERRAKEGK